MATPENSEPDNKPLTLPSSAETLFEAAQRLSWDTNIWDDENYVYYKNETGIFKYDKVTRKEECILEEMNVCHLFFDGKTLYFMSYEEWENKRIYELNTDGAKNLIGGVGSAAPYFYLCNSIFYISFLRDELSKFDSVSGQVSDFLVDVGGCEFIGSSFYYTGYRKVLLQQKNFVRQINLLTWEETQLFLTDMPAYVSLTVFGNELYIVNEYLELCKYIEEKGLEKLCGLPVTDECSDAVFSPRSCISDKLYYILTGTGNTGFLYSYDPVTGESQAIIDGIFSRGAFTVFHDVLINSFSINIDGIAQPTTEYFLLE